MQRPDGRSFRTIRWLAALGLLVVVVVGALSWVGRRRVYRTVASSETTLDSAGVRPGIPASRLMTILDSLGVTHSPMSADGTVHARLGRSFEELMVQGDILAEFRFDSAGRLTSRRIREVLTGP